MKTAQRMRQVGFIKFGNGLNKRVALDNARKQGYFVRVKKGFAELWQTVAG